MKNHALILLVVLILALLIFPYMKKENLDNKLVINTVIITFFDGERQAMASMLEQRNPANKLQELDFQQGYLPLLYDATNSVLLLTTGMGTARSAASVMALGMDDRFDLTNAVFISAGIGGGDPDKVSLASVVITDFVVDGDINHAIDMRDLDSEKFKYGILPFFKFSEFATPVNPMYKENEYYKLPEEILAKASLIVKNIKLPEPEKKVLLRQQDYANSGYTNAMNAPNITIGSNLAGQSFWYGIHKMKWANDWVKYFTSGQGDFFTSAMEDSGCMQSFYFLSKAGKINFKNIIILRAISDYVVPPTGTDIVAQLEKELGEFPAMSDSLANLSIVVDKLLDDVENLKNN